MLTIDHLNVSAYTIPTDLPEGDGTLDWNSTTLVLVQAIGGSQTGIGYTYADTATARLIEDKLNPLVQGSDIGNIPRLWKQMAVHTRNLGHAGIVAMAISAVDTALWDLKARVLGIPLCELLGMVRDSIPLYGSGGFTSYSIGQLQKQYEKGKYDVSVRCGERGLLPAVRNASKETLIVADGFSCREQIEQLTDRGALHLAEVIDLAMKTGPDGPTGDYPEKARGVAASEKKPNKNPLLGLFALVCGLVIGWMVVNRKRKLNRR